MWAGVVPQQPPTRLTQPSSTNRRILKARLSGVSPYWPRSSGSPALGYTLTKQVAIWASVRRWSVMNSGPGGAVEPDREEAEMLQGHVEGLHALARQHRAHRLDGRAHQQGQLDAGLAHGLPEPERRGLHVQRVLLSLEQQRVHAAVDERPRLQRRRPACTSSKVTLRVTEMDRVDGPRAPTTKPSPAASRARRGAGPGDLPRPARPARTRPAPRARTRRCWWR